MVAPCFMLAEVTNAIHQRVRRGDLGTDEAGLALAQVLSAGVDLEEDEILHLVAARLAVQLGRGSTYDAHYLALAERYGCEVWTGDRRLYNGVRERFPLIRWIGHELC
jgi:predicted nucleic acid-binding protein